MRSGSGAMEYSRVVWLSAAGEEGQSVAFACAA
jgi:hypothetical protein